MVEKMLSFAADKIAASEYQITSLNFRGWKIHITPILKKVILTGVSEDGSPITQLSIEFVTTPIPPMEKEEDNR